MRVSASEQTWAADHQIGNRRPGLGRRIDDDQDIADLLSRLDVRVGLNDLVQGYRLSMTGLNSPDSINPLK